MTTMPAVKAAPGLPRLLRSALAGCLATVPMTGAMAAGYRGLPGPEQYPLPPRLIMDHLFRHLPLQERTRGALTWVAHFSMGTAAALPYTLLPAQRSPLARWLTGMGYGLGVWAANYLVVLPVLRLLAPATRQPPPRRALMIGSHLVWGATLAQVATALMPTRLPQQ